VVEAARGTVLIWALALGVAALLGWRMLGSDRGGSPSPVRIDGPAAGRSDARRGNGPGAAPAQEGIYVHVAGRVRRPGLLRLPAGSRVAAAVARAGGFARRADAAAVNLAARLEDGQQVVVPRLGAAGPAGPAGLGATASAGADAGPISLASATAEQLDGIDGIGPTLAERIVEHRDSQGGVASVGGLREVEGIGEKRFAALREALGP
jgi:competence protein ComEA